MPPAGAVTALRIAADLRAASATQLPAMDVAKGALAGKIDLADMVTLPCGGP